jgi:hypothetical protein
MEFYNDKVIEINELIKKNDFMYKPKAKELIEYLQNLEKKRETSETQLTAILLNFILENYSLSGFNFNLINERTLNALEVICRNLYNNVLPNVYDFFDNIKSGKEKLNPFILESCKTIYKRKQINFIRQFYSKLSINTMKAMFPQKEVDKIIFEEGWTKEGEYVIPNNKNAPPEFNVGKEIEDIKYINNMNIQFNKLIKEHSHLVSFQNGSKK